MLELSLEDYEGTVFFISHDRYFIDKIATRILEVTPHGVVSYLGNYSDYMEKKQQLAELEAAKLAEESNATTTNNVTDYQKQKEQRRLEQQRKRQLEDIESKIAAYEEELEYKKAELFQEEVYLDTQKSAQVQARIEELEELIMESMETWEELSLS